MIREIRLFRFHAWYPFNALKGNLERLKYSGRASVPDHLNQEKVGTLFNKNFPGILSFIFVENRTYIYPGWQIQLYRILAFLNPLSYDYTSMQIAENKLFILISYECYQVLKGILPQLAKLHL